MFFKDVIGQEKLINKLIREVNEGRIPHAQLFVGKEGVGKLAVAIAYARYISCNHRNENDACGICSSCIMFNKLQHPDLHFIFPVIKKKISDDYIKEWRTLIVETPYFSLEHWLQKINAENQQAVIYTKESEEIIKKLALKSSQGGYKFCIIWLPERMKTEGSNKLLKLLEEPPKKTLFLLLSEAPEQLLTTIISRTQKIPFDRLSEDSIKKTLIQKHNINPENAQHLAHLANGNYIKALEVLDIEHNTNDFNKRFIELMRLAYKRNLKELRNWSFDIASIGREKQKQFLAYTQRLIRENFIYNFHENEMNYMTQEEENFSIRFSPFINERNVIELINELSEAQIDISQNVNAKMVFFDLSMKVIMLLKKT